MSRRSSSAVAASRTWNCTGWPTGARAVMAVEAGLLGGARHAADDGKAGPFVIDLLQEVVGGKRERIAKDDHHGVRGIDLVEVVRPTEQARAVDGLFEGQMKRRQPGAGIPT